MFTGNMFQFISLVLAISALIKVFFGIFYHQQLYSWAKAHYSQEKRGTAVNLLLIYALALLGLVWYATLTQYIPWGWVLTVFITSASVKSLGILVNWRTFSAAFAQLILRAGRKLWLVDLFVGVLGFFFLFMAWRVY